MSTRVTGPRSSFVIEISYRPMQASSKLACLKPARSNPSQEAHSSLPVGCAAWIAVFARGGLGDR
jgi:hypothetical protein